MEAVIKDVDISVAYKSIYDFIEDSTLRYNKKNAFTFDRDYSYEEVKEITDKYVEILEKVEVGEGSVVAIDMKKSIDFIACIFAIKKLGAGTFIVDTDILDHTFDYYIEKANITHLVVDSSGEEKIEACKIRFVRYSSKAMLI
ncbi:MAG: AMP-binding protein [Butyrivibrio sp.]|nr:AMP-binding protein [Butyrivibrio sp.]